MSEEWEKVSDVPLGTLVRIKGLGINFTYTGRDRGIYHNLDYNLPAIEGERVRFRISKRGLVHRVPLLPRL